MWSTACHDTSAHSGIYQPHRRQRQMLHGSETRPMRAQLFAQPLTLDGCARIIPTPGIITSSNLIVYRYFVGYDALAGTTG
jgi:hypothetical protein